MEIAFLTTEVRAICERASRARRLLGEEVALELQARLSDLEACESVFDLVVGNPRIVVRSGREEFQVAIGEGVILRLAPNNTYGHFLKSGQTDWKKVDRIRVLGIENGAAKDESVSA